MPSTPSYASRVIAGLEPHLGGEPLVAGAELTITTSRRTEVALTAGPALLEVAFIPLRVHLLRWLPHNPLWPDEVWALTYLLPALIVVAVASRVLRPATLAITRTQVVWADVSRYGKRLRRVTTVPLLGARIVSYRSGRRSTRATIGLPGRPPLRFRATSDKRRDLDRVLATAVALGLPSDVSGVAVVSQTGSEAGLVAQ